MDAPTRQALFGDMINILQETQCTTVMVTHDRNEAQTLAHRVAVILMRQIVQMGSPKEIFFPAGFRRDRQVRGHGEYC